MAGEGIHIDAWALKYHLAFFNCKTHQNAFGVRVPPVRPDPLGGGELTLVSTAAAYVSLYRRVNRNRSYSPARSRQDIDVFVLGSDSQADSI